jgi:hypothetical protein
VNPVNDPSWEAVLNVNDLGTMRPDVPVLETHGLLDEVIPHSVEVALHNQYCDMGVTAQLDSYLADHVLTALFDQTDVVNWLSGRFAGQPAPENCWPRELPPRGRGCRPATPPSRGPAAPARFDCSLCRHSSANCDQTACLEHI